MTYSKQGIFISQRKYVHIFCKKHTNLDVNLLVFPSSKIFLKAMLGIGLVFKIGGSLIMEVYTYAYYASLVSDRKSITGLHILVWEPYKVITLGPNELPNLVSSSRLDDYNYL
ncbi:hypothetical protein CR513_58591, partial [Mucuna pruriens]